jgi:CMP-N-acetylneuraminic acid synthetase
MATYLQLTSTCKAKNQLSTSFAFLLHLMDTITHFRDSYQPKAKQFSKHRKNHFRHNVLSFLLMQQRTVTTKLNSSIQTAKNQLLTLKRTFMLENSTFYKVPRFTQSSWNLETFEMLKTPNCEPYSRIE